MQNFLSQENVWYPLKFLGITHKLTAINLDTIYLTWVAMFILTVVLFIIRHYLLKSKGLSQYIAQSTIVPFIDMVEQGVGRFNLSYYYFVASIFLFILACNWIAFIPGLSEPTKDLNTTLALSIVAFIYIQKKIADAHGIKAYLKEYFMPFDIIFPLNLIAGLALFPFKFIGELVSSFSLALRLFGNIFGGFIIIHLFHGALGNSVIFNVLGIPVALILSGFFVFFEGFLQAFVFSTLVLTNISMAVQLEEGH